jgi:hypothetical protein
MPHPVDPAAHDTHDALLVAAFAAGDAIGRDQVTASTLVATCPDCAALHRDLRAIAAALPELPAPARPRDFRITAEQAASLRPAGWRGMLATLAGPRFSFAVPLGSGLAALGLAGILLGSFAGLPLGAGGAASASSAPAAVDTRDAAEGGAPAEMPSAAPPVNEVLVQGEPVPSAMASEAPAMAPASGSPSYAQPSGADDAMAKGDGVAVDPVAGLAVAALVLGSALVAGRLIARRLARAG